MRKALLLSDPRTLLLLISYKEYETVGSACRSAVIDRVCERRLVCCLGDIVAFALHFRARALVFIRGGEEAGEADLEHIASDVQHELISSESKVLRTCIPQQSDGQTSSRLRVQPTGRWIFSTFQDDCTIPLQQKATLVVTTGATGDLGAEQLVVHKTAKAVLGEFFVCWFPRFQILQTGKACKN